MNEPPLKQRGPSTTNPRQAFYPSHMHLPRSLRFEHDLHFVLALEPRKEFVSGGDRVRKVIGGGEQDLRRGWGEGRPRMRVGQVFGSERGQWAVGGCLGPVARAGEAHGFATMDYNDDTNEVAVVLVCGQIVGRRWRCESRSVKVSGVSHE